MEVVNKELITNLKENGVIVLKDFYDYETEIKPIQLEIYNLIKLIIETNNIPLKQEEFNGNNFDSKYLDLIKIDRNYGSIIYDASKQLFSFMKILSSQKNQNLYKMLRNSQAVGIAHNSYGIRIDNPNEEKYATDWHQEYLGHLRSSDGVVFWAPLHQVKKEMGAVEVMLKSNQEGVKTLINQNDDNQFLNKYTQYGINLKIKDMNDLLNKYEIVCPETNAGDLIVMDYCTIHKSGKNISNKARWSMQMRYFNFEDIDGQKIGWKGSYASGIDPANIYPKYFER